MNDEWGISDGYWDITGNWHQTSDATRALLRAAMGEPQAGPGMWFVAHGSSEPLWNACDIVLEDGRRWAGMTSLPPELPLGYHTLHPVDGSPPTDVVVYPTACPELPRMWGVAVQTASLWSDASWGIGDLRDLAALATQVLAAGGGALLISPLHQPAPTFPVEPSPYYPSTRRAWGPLLLAMDGPPPAVLRCTGDTLIDRDAVWLAKRAALETLFSADDAAAAGGAAGGDAAAGAGAASLEPSPISWWNARREAIGLDPEVDIARLARFHEWLQIRLEIQLAAVTATGIALIGDLAVGFAPDGADADAYADVLALDLRLGAPPDPFNDQGQDWGIPPFVPSKLRAARYQPFIDTVRAAFHGVNGLRIDHVMGLFRQFLIPTGGSPADGAYVQFPAEELLSILCLEAVRAGAFVIGEDLGTVAPEVRAMLAQRRIAATKVLWFEPGLPGTWPQQALATITTHDLPTITGVFQSANSVDGDQAMRDRLSAVAPNAVTAAEAIHAAHDALLASPAGIRLLAAEDLCGSPRRPNLPGLNDYPSWRTRLPVPVAHLSINGDSTG